MKFAQNPSHCTYLLVHFFVHVIGTARIFTGVTAKCLQLALEFLLIFLGSLGLFVGLVGSNTGFGGLGHQLHELPLNSLITHFLNILGSGYRHCVK